MISDTYLLHDGERNFNWSEEKKINVLQFRVLIFILKDVRTSHVTRSLICIFALDSSYSCSSPNFAVRHLHA